MTTTVLVIEDNEINMDMMIFILQALGMVVLPALNGPAGLAMARSERPDLIISDIQMPEVDGYGVLRALKCDPALSHIPVIALTALSMVGDSQRMLDAGFDGYLSKPIEFDDLKSELRKHIPNFDRKIHPG